MLILKSLYTDRERGSFNMFQLKSHEISLCRTFSPDVTFDILFAFHVTINSGSVIHCIITALLFDCSMNFTPKGFLL